MATINVTFLLVILPTVLISFNFSPTANAHLKNWNKPPNGNIIQQLTGTDAKNKDDILLPKQHRTKPQEGDGAAAAEDSKTSGTVLQPNQDDEVATEIMQTQSGNENGNRKAQAEKSIANRPDKEESDSVLKNEPGIVESDPMQNVNILTEPIASSSILSEGKETSAMDTPEVFKDVPLVIVYEDSGDVLEDSPRAMNMNSESNLVSEPEKPSIIKEKEDVSETNPESQKMMVKLRRVGEDTTLLHNLTSEMNTMNPKGVETEDSTPFAKEETSLVGNNGVRREPLSDNDSRQVIQNNVTQNTSAREWKNYDLEKNEDSTALPIQNIIEAYSKQLRPHNSNEETDTVDNTGGELNNFWPTYDHNDSEDDDGSPKNTFSLSLYSRDAHENNPQASLYKLNNGMETRYFVHGHDPLYYVGNPAGSEYMRTRREDIPQMCVVPCSPVNYIMQPYHYGYYDAAPDHSYATGVQLPHLHLHQVPLPPVKFPDLHEITSTYPSVSFDGHGGHASSSENAQGHNYVVTTNTHAGASQSHKYGSASYSHVKDPLSHMAYSLDTPLKYVQTSMVLKPSDPYKKLFPSMDNV